MDWKGLVKAQTLGNGWGCLSPGSLFSNYAPDLPMSAMGSVVPALQVLQISHLSGSQVSKKEQS